MMLASNSPLVAAFGFAVLILVVVLARMVMSRRYTLALRFFGFGLTLTPASRRPPDSAR